MPSEEIRVDPARLRELERRVADWADRVDEHTSYANGSVSRSLDAAARAVDGTALSDALTGASVASARAGDGLVSALRALSAGLVGTAEEYEQADRDAARRTSGEDPS